MVESEQAIAGIAEDVGRGDQPQAEHDCGHLLPTLQRNILQLCKAEHQDADRNRIQDHEAAFRIDNFMACLRGKPWRQHDQHAKQHAAPVFPCSMSAEKTKVRHCKPPLKRGIRQRLASMTLRLSNDLSGRIGGVCLCKKWERHCRLQDPLHAILQSATGWGKMPGPFTSADEGCRATRITGMQQWME